MTNPTSKNVRQIMDSLRRIVRALRLYSREAERRTGLSAAQLFVMQQLWDSNEATLKALAGRTLTDLSSVSVVVGRLARKGLLLRQRSTDDGRALSIRLSPQGKRLFQKRPDALQARLIQGLGKLKPTKRKALAAGLREWLEASELSPVAPMFFETEPK